MAGYSAFGIMHKLLRHPCILWQLQCTLRVACELWRIDLLHHKGTVNMHMHKLVNMVVENYICTLCVHITVLFDLLTVYCNPQYVKRNGTRYFWPNPFVPYIIFIMALSKKASSAFSAILVNSSIGPQVLDSERRSSLWWNSMRPLSMLVGK